MKKIFLIVVLSILMVVAMPLTAFGFAHSSQEEKTILESDFSWDNITAYHVLTDRFYNGDDTNDHSYNRLLYGDSTVVDLTPNSDGQAVFQGGDFAGIIQKIDEGYFTDLGVNVIIMSAPYEQIHGYVIGFSNSTDQFPHFGYSGDYALDYTETDKNFGTKEEFQTLVDTAHQNNMRVVLNINVNNPGYHTLYDMDEYEFGDLNHGWSDYYYSYYNFNSYIYNGYINYNSSSTWSNWWGSDWVRAGFPGYTTSNGDVLMNVNGLPDFKTESNSSVTLPSFLQTKWKQEGTYNYKASNYGTSDTVSGYLTSWLTEWVREYGVDGFSINSIKHVEIDFLNELSIASTQALKDWKTENPEKALDDQEFWITGEAWDHGLNKSAYFYNGFDSLINFDLYKNFPTAQSVESQFSHYANTLNTDPNFNMLSFASYDSTSLLRSGDNIEIGSILMMMPGGIQILYGDETNRSTLELAPGASSTSEHNLRSFMNWDSINENTLEHWQKLGVFRNNHLSVGAGEHNQISAYNSATGYTFSRSYSKDGVTDNVIVTLFAPLNEDVEVNVSSIWVNGTTLINAYNGTKSVVSNGIVTVNSGENGTILLEDAADTKYTISIKETLNGNVNTSPNLKSKANEIVTITATPESGYRLDSINVTRADGVAVSVSQTNDTTFTFTMPESAVTIDISFLITDAGKLAMDKTLMLTALNKIAGTNLATAQSILLAINDVAIRGTTASWSSDPIIKAASRTEKGAITGTINLVNGTATDSLPVDIEIPLLRGDVNDNGIIDIDDLRIIANVANYNKSTSDSGVNINADINNDGKINFSDLAFARNSISFGH